MTTRPFLCPYCSKEMAKGLVHGDRYALKWIAGEDDHGPLFQGLFTKGIKLTRPFTDPALEVFYCPDCAKMVIDLEDK